MNLIPSKDYYVIKLIEAEKKAGALLLVDENSLPIRQATIVAVPSHQDDDFTLSVGATVLLQRHCGIDYGMPGHLIIKKDYILAEVIQ